MKLHEIDLRATDEIDKKYKASDGCIYIVSCCGGDLADERTGDYLSETCENLQELLDLDFEEIIIPKTFTFQNLIWYQGKQYVMRDVLKEDMKVIVDGGELFVIGTGKSITEFVRLEGISKSNFTEVFE